MSVDEYLTQALGKLLMENLRLLAALDGLQQTNAQLIVKVAEAETLAKAAAAAGNGQEP